MKIFIGTDTAELNGMVAKRFGHTAFYIIYDTESKTHQAISNTEHDDKHSILAEVINMGVEVFIVGNIGPHAFSLLNRGGIKVYLAGKMTAEEALNKLANEELELLTEPTIKKSMHHH
ncbi:MAG: dinitrogenase iron-molybdenum cofactor biosynthesis protein [Ignavibacteriae bacterium]|nr:dinitrogenase iron-molybdenum cofactor biosynthesis protein [Ignavibacteriota bacterium]